MRDMCPWIRAATDSQIGAKTSAAYARLLADAGFDRVELLPDALDDFDERIGEMIPSIIHRRLLKRAVRSLVEAGAPCAAELAATVVEDATDDASTNASIQNSPAAPLLKLHVNGPGGPICSISLDPASKLDDLKAAIEDSTGIPVPEQRLFHEVDELSGEGALSGLLPPGSLEEDLLLVAWSPVEVAELLDAPVELSDEFRTRGRAYAFCEGDGMFEGFLF